MKLEWLDDLIAVLDSNSLNEAARRRFLTQPAFSRRIRALERHVGAELFDRSRKPLAINSSVTDSADRIRELATALRELTRELRYTPLDERVLVLACQHAISTAQAPSLVGDLSRVISARIKLRSANSDECFSLLLTGDADIALMYRLSVSDRNEPKAMEGQQRSEQVIVESLGEDRFVPVIGTTHLAQYQTEIAQGVINIVACPPQSFLGKVLNQRILPQLQGEVRWTAETALTPAALQFALSGVGIAWLPYSLVQAALASGELSLLDQALPDLMLEVTALHRKHDSSEVTRAAWQWLVSRSLPPGTPPLN